MKVLVIDGQGGGIGKSIITRLKSEMLPIEIIAAGTNSLALSSMLKAGADAGATGENAICYNASHCTAQDIITGPVGIIRANAMHGEISPAMALAVSGSEASILLIPSNKCSLSIAGLQEKPLAAYIDEVVFKIRLMLSAS